MLFDYKEFAYEKELSSYRRFIITYEPKEKDLHSQKEIKFEFSDRIAPVVLKNKKNNNYTHIIMPLNSWS